MFGKRYLAIAVSIFAIGVIFGVKVFNVDTFSSCAIFASVAILSLCACVYFVRVKVNFFPKRIIAATFAVAAFSFGILRVGLYNESVRDSEIFSGKSDSVEFEIHEIRENSVDAILLDSTAGVEWGEMVRLYIDFDDELLVTGDKIYADVIYKYIDNESLRANSISLTARGEVIDFERGNGLFCEARRYISEASASMYKDFTHGEAISKAVIVGDKSDIDSYLYSIYNAGGISHILSISGLHVSLIALVLQRLLVQLTLDRRIACLVSSIFVLLYASLVGFTPSVARATVMILAIMISRMFMRRADSITALFIALSILLIINPYALFSVSLQLSFLSSLAILVFEPIFDRVNEFFKEKSESSGRVLGAFWRFTNLLITPALLSFATSVFSFSVLCVSFDSVSYVSPLVNIFAVPLFSYALIFAIIAIMVAGISMPIATIIAAPAGYLFDFISGIGEMLYKFDIGRISSYIELIYIPCTISIVMIASLLFLHKNRMKAFVASSVAFCVSIAACGIANGYSKSGVTLIEYGNSRGEYVFYVSEETSIYFDLGGYYSEPEIIYQSGYTALDKYVITDYSEYAYENFEYFGASTSVSEVFVQKPKNIYEIDIFNRIKELANRRNCDIITFENVLSFELSDVSVDFVKDNLLGEGSLISFGRDENSICVFEGGFPVLEHCDYAVITDFNEDHYLDSHFKDAYYYDASVKNDSFVNYNKTFKERIRFITKDGESDIDIYEP